MRIKGLTVFLFIVGLSASCAEKANYNYNYGAVKEVSILLESEVAGLTATLNIRLSKDGQWLAQFDQGYLEITCINCSELKYIENPSSPKKVHLIFKKQNNDKTEDIVMTIGDTVSIYGQNFYVVAIGWDYEVIDNHILSEMEPYPNRKEK